VRLLGDEPPPPRLPEGVEVVTLAERPELLEAAHPLACEGYADMATDGLVQIDLEDWLRDEGTLPAGSFVALAGGEIVGYAGLSRHDNEGVAEDGLTVVRREWRRRGLGSVLPSRDRHLDPARQRGMRAVNERLGYVYRDVAVTLIAPLPLRS
jgi:mycothiol synthase